MEPVRLPAKRMPPRRSRTRWGGRSVAGIVVITAAVTLAACTNTTTFGDGQAQGGTGSAGGSMTTGGDGAGSKAIVPGKASTLHWHACTGQLAGMQCTSLQVPLNYADPNGKKITLALSMVPATAPVSQQQGVLLVNPGGPGQSGLSLADDVALGLNQQVAETYDIVGFDTRGVGSSQPALSCDPNFFKGVRPDYIPSSQAAEQVLIDRAKSYAAGCEKRFGWFLPYITSANMARDMDQIRKAFGVQQVNYYAYSYGTYLGQVYGTLFPQRVRRMVLDSTVDPTGAWYNDNISQDYAFQGRLEAFFAWVANYDGTYHLGSTSSQVQQAYNKARTQLTANPAGGTVGPDEFDDTFLTAGYINSVWPAFAHALAQYVNYGDGGALVAQHAAWGTQPENSFAVYNAVECNDVNWPRNWAKWQSDTEKVYKTAPFQAWDNAWFNAACAFWPVKGPAEAMKINGKKLPPILMLQGTLDAATPYAGAQDAHRLLPSARMVVVVGGGNHGQSLASPDNACVDGYLNRYLAAGTLPEKPGLVNATCRPTADPTPSS